MTSLASALINWSALWKIVLVALIGGCGVVIAFALLLLSVKNAREASSGGGRVGHWTLAGICVTMCVGVGALGVYAMVEKPSSKTAPKPNSVAAPARIIRST